MNTVTATKIVNDMLWMFEMEYPELFKVYESMTPDDRYALERKLIEVIKHVVND